MSDFATFKKAFKGDLILPSDPDYPTAVARWAVNAERNAKIIACVKDNEDVVLAISYARANQLPIAIRGGGHNPSGASSSQDGLVIDLSKYINTVRVDPKEKLAYVGGGALWATVDKEAIKYGLATVGGTVNHVGVGGLTLGGGYGWLSSAHGLVIDNLVQATVVTANGDILTTSDAENPDLFFGLRGGGCNFGVVTEFVLKLHPQRATVYAGVVVFPQTSLEKLVDATNEWLPGADDKVAMMQVVTISEGNPVIIVTLFYNGPEAEGRERFKPLFDIGPIADRTKEIPFEALNGLHNDRCPDRKGVYTRGVLHEKPNVQHVRQAISVLLQAYQEHALRPAIVFEHFPLHKVTLVPRDKMAIRRDPTSNVMIVLAWEGKSVADDGFSEKEREAEVGRAKKIAQQLVEIITSQQQPEMEEIHGIGYSNYNTDALSGSADERARLVFAENYPKLQRIKKRYDPDNVFNKWFPITPAA